MSAPVVKQSNETHTTIMISITIANQTNQQNMVVPSLKVGGIVETAGTVYI